MLQLLKKLGLYNIAKYTYKSTRMFFLLTFKYNFKKVGKRFNCGKYIYVRPNTVTVGNDVFIGSYANLAVRELIIDDFAQFGPRVGIVGGDHRFDVVGTSARFTGRAEEKPVYIGRDAWVGYGSTILHGVTVGEGSIIGAGSLVLKDIPPYCIYAGHPAKFLKFRFDSIDKAIEHSRKLGGTFHKEFQPHKT